MKLQKMIKSVSATVLAATLIVTAVPQNVTLSKAATDNVYLLMNIPYSDFYANEIENGSDVQAVTSATTNKWKNTGLVPGTYSIAQDNGGKILGITYPVKVSASDYTKIQSDTETYTQTDTTAALASATDYDYYVLTDTEVAEEGAVFNGLSSSVGFYKELTIGTDDKAVFSKSTSTETSVTGTITAEADSKYGDYQLTVTRDAEDTGSVLGAVISTDKGDFALRSLENIWKSGTSLAWTVGIKKTESHGNDLSYMSKYYEATNGCTINSVIYYTTNGIVTYTIADGLKLQNKSSAALSVTSDSIASTDNSVTIKLSEALPEDFAPSYAVDKQTATLNGSTLTTESAFGIGSHTITISDTNQKYASLSAAFVAYTDAVPAQYDSENKALTKTESATEEEFSAYLKAISKVKVGETSYAASGKRATVVINTKDGSIDLSNTDSKDAASVEITVSATGYSKDLTFTYPGEEKKPENTTDKNDGNTDNNSTNTNDNNANANNNNTNANNTTTTSTDNTGAAGAAATATSSDTSSKTSSKPAKVSNVKVKRLSGKKKMSVTWKKVSGASGYQVQYSTKKTFKSAKKVTVKKAKTIKTTLKNLNKKKKYYVRVRAYKTVNGKKIYGTWSAKKKA